MEQKKIALVGYGAMGKRIAAAIKDHEGWELLGVIDPLNEECFSSLSLLPEKPHVVIDFSHPANLEMILSYCREQEVPCVLSTTGFSPAQEAMCRELSAYTPVVRTQNTSLGINIMEEILRTITPVLKDRFDIEIIEKHHNKKIDAPSGTAKMLARAIEESGDFPEVHGRDGVCPRQKGEIGIHAIRGGTIVGEHTVLFAGDDELIEIKHTALSKQVFVAGAIKAAEFALSAPKGFYSMGDALFPHNAH
ncbi:4-hydroxy-tetrahydrodipicolinate reductase [Intestinimonas butyriciproducens]|uniref:4-hydroxy-tetrahydrodipicolinate reductase n=1 Tax=Intestinimonas butyriciproducens TaxID=1297617 RepID=UPI0019581B28|nr:4-hydroxy-tetrahydrodipicolinate reductase [Intestinimonas butyriciproducens]MBM6917209.1 4-hydroxy-tetrahydrodipicolinate reductase [Intestinimonas butyriciproducens]